MSERSTTATARPLVRGRRKQQLLYRQLADILRREIERARLQPGTALPSMDALARKYSLNKATVRQAIAELTAAGLIYSVPARGTFVADPSTHKTATRDEPPQIAWVLSVSDDGNTGRYHTEILDAVQNALREIRAHPLIMNACGMTTTALCRALAEAHLDGAILIGGFDRETIRHLAGTGMPAVLIDDTCRGARMDSILVDNHGGGYQAVEHLLALGHRQIALVIGYPSLQITKDRLAGALEAAADAGLDASDVQVIPGDFSPESGRKAAARILSARQRPTAVFFFNDEMASGALQTFYESGKVEVPRDISVVGFDDISWASLTHPPLTTIHVEKDRMGREAVARLRERLADPNHIPSTAIIPTRLVLRKTTATPIQRGHR